MAQYIRRQLGVGELTNWTVFLPSADSKPVTLGGRTLNSVKRKPREDRSTPGLYIVRTILSPLDESIDLTDDEFRAALALTNAERAAEGELPTDRPNGPNVRKVRGERPQNGLLVIYPLDPDIGLGPRVTERPVIGVVVSFPDSPTARRQTFVENLVKTREEPS